MQGSTAARPFSDEAHSDVGDVRTGARIDMLIACAHALLGRGWKLRDNISAYDAMYVALAEAMNAPIVTCDGPLANAPGPRARIEVIE